jgi:ribosome-binding ATPase
MKVVIAGFPRVGKTTVFQSLTGLAEASAGGKGGVSRGVIRVPDARVDRLSEIYQPKKTTYATISFVDVQADAAASDKATVLSPALLAEIRDADAVVGVVRDFPDLAGAAPEPLRELGRFEEELVLTDAAVLEKRLERLGREGKKGTEHVLLTRLVEVLTEGKPLRTQEISAADEKTLSGYQLVSRKPLLVVLNRDDARAAAPIPEALAAEAREHGAEVLALAGRLEREIAELPPEDQAPFLRDAGLEASARDRFVQAAYRLLDLLSFLTSGEDEVRAWSIRRGTVAQRAAGKIHSDIEKGFIRAEVISYEDFVRYGSEAECKKAGRARLEGKEYVVADGDIVHFRFNV